jgi:hypothetical protein
MPVFHRPQQLKQQSDSMWEENLDSIPGRNESFFTQPKQILGPILPPIQGYLKLLPRWVYRPEGEIKCSLSSSAELKKYMELISIFTSIRLYHI